MPKITTIRSGFLMHNESKFENGFGWTGGRMHVCGYAAGKFRR